MASPTLFAQTGNARASGEPAQRSRANLAKPELRVPTLSPDLERILREWYEQTKTVNRLEGSHYRFVYDKVFQTEKRSIGKFWYQAPDSGRIDISPRKIKPSEKSARTSAKGKPYSLKSSDKLERWISNGKSIITVDVKEKTYETFPIPEDRQGQNIMDGPLPFLFGMPPDKAKRRYHFRLDQESEKSVMLSVKPKLRQDAANWKMAKVILSKPKYLPSAVLIDDPSGNLQTVYKFGNLTANRSGWTNLVNIIRGDPFASPGFGYKPVKTNAGPAARAKLANAPQRKPAVRKGEALVPSVIGMAYPEAKKLLERAGFASKFLRGSPTANKKLLYHVERQQPAARTPFKKNQTVVLKLYDKPKDVAARP